LLQEIWKVGATRKVTLIVIGVRPFVAETKWQPIHKKEPKRMSVA